MDFKNQAKTKSLPRMNLKTATGRRQIAACGLSDIGLDPLDCLFCFFTAAVSNKPPRTFGHKSPNIKIENPSIPPIPKPSRQPILTGNTR